MNQEQTTAVKTATEKKEPILQVDLRLASKLAEELEIELTGVMKKYYDKLPYEKADIHFVITEFLYRPKVMLMVNPQSIKENSSSPAESA